MKPIIITIVCTSQRGFDVYVGERFVTWLCWEEMLGQIATLTHPDIKKPRFPMQTPDDVISHMERYSRKGIKE